MKKLKQSQKSSKPQVLTAGQAAQHCQVSIPALKRWIRNGQIAAFRTPGGHYRVELTKFRRFLRQYGMPDYPAPSTEVRILIADDDARVVHLLLDFLAADARGFKLETATDGYEALIKVGAFRPTILILDVRMPLLDGIEVCRRLRASPETRAIKILGITGYSDIVPAFLEAGAEACLTKPLDLKRLKQELERLLASLET